MKKALILLITILIMTLVLSSCHVITQPAETKETKSGSLSQSETSDETQDNTETFSDNDPSLLYIDYLKAGKADCIVIRQNGLTIMIDTGLNTTYSSASSYLDQLGIERIDYMIITHFDNDHIGSAGQLIQNYEVGELIVPDYVRDSQYYNAMIDAAEEKSLTLTRLADDKTIESGELTITINPTHLYDEVELDPDNTDDSVDNDFSLITTLRFGANRFLFLGDAEKARLEEFMNTSTLSVYQAIKLPHHGDYYKAIKTLLDKTVPEAVVTCIDNETNMDASLVTLLKEKGIPSYLTCDGTVRLISDGKTVSIDQ